MVVRKQTNQNVEHIRDKCSDVLKSNTIVEEIAMVDMYTVGVPDIDYP